MGQARPPLPAMLILAIASRHESAFNWALDQAASSWGPIWDTGPRFVFDQTDFYRESMGDRVQKQLVALDALIDPATLPDCKLTSNRWESEYAGTHDHPQSRPLNLDPGYVTEAKLVLATVKNRDHRIYLRDGIYAEVTLSFHGKQWNGSRWTYPDYLLEPNLGFLSRCRDELRRRIHR